MTLKILLIGKIGQLGWEAQRSLATLGDIFAVDYPEIDFTRPEEARKILMDVQPNIIYNAVAYTAVDKAESDYQTACLINSETPGILAEQARKIGACFIHFSTDFVFDGEKGSAYTEADQPNPINAYGKTKLDGETAIQKAGGNWMIFRTSWVYTTRRASFVTKVLEWSRKQRTMKVVTDQIGSPTWARSLAEITAQMISMGGTDPVGWLQEKAGIYHLAGDGAASRYEWTQEILKNDPNKEEQAVQEVIPGLSSEFPSPAARPAYSALNCEHFYNTFGLRLPAWQKSLQLAMEQPT